MIVSQFWGLTNGTLLRCAILHCNYSRNQYPEFTLLDLNRIGTSYRSGICHLMYRLQWLVIYSDLKKEGSCCKSYDTCTSTEVNRTWWWTNRRPRVGKNWKLKNGRRTERSDDRGHKLSTWIQEWQYRRKCLHRSTRCEFTIHNPVNAGGKTKTASC